jgi:hypothetical protein
MNTTSFALLFALANELNDGTDLGIATASVEVGEEISEPSASITEIDPATIAEPVTAKSKAKTEKVKVDKGPSKAHLAYELVAKNFAAVASGTAVPRTQMIKKLESELGMSNTGAATYYHNATVKYRAEVEAKGQAIPELPRAQTGKPKAIKAVDSAATGPAAQPQTNSPQ